MNATSQVIPPAPLFYRSLQMTLDQNLRGFSTGLRSSSSSVQRLQGRATVVDEQVEREDHAETRGRPDHRIRCITDRMGGSMLQPRLEFLGPKPEQAMHIDCLELLAATLAVQTFAKHKSQVSILLRLDSTTAVAYINNLGGTVSKELVVLAKNLWMRCLERNIHLLAQHLPGKKNVVADMQNRVMTD